MAISEDSSTPAVVTGTGTPPSPATLTTASFSPPANSLLVALVGGGWGNAVTTTATVTDTGSHTWSVGAETTGPTSTQIGGLSQVFYTYLSSAPGSITITVTYTNLTGGGYLTVRVLAGAAANQVGPGIGQTLQSGTSSNVAECTIPLSVVGSVVYGMVDDPNTAATLTAVSGTTLISPLVDTTDSITLAPFKSTNPTTVLGDMVFGGTLSANDENNVAAMEIIPAGAVLPRRNWCTNPACGTDTTGWVGDGTDALTRVTRTGFLRPDVCRMTIASTPPTTSSLGSPIVPARAGQTWVVSLQIACSVSKAMTVFLNFRDSNQAFLTPNPSVGITATPTPQTVTFTGTTAPTNTYGIDITAQGNTVFTAGQTVDVSCVLYEQASTAGVYADGDSPAWLWDGTAEDSSSRAGDTASPYVLTQYGAFF